MPKVTVLMPMRNVRAYVGDAVRSILEQTFKDFELLVMDDGSTDGSGDLARSFDDPRIRVISGVSSRGVAAVLNRGLDLAQGEYIVRMDADDVSRPCRVAHQLTFMEAHPSVGICGSRTGRS